MVEARGEAVTKKEIINLSLNIAILVTFLVLLVVLFFVLSPL